MLLAVLISRIGDDKPEIRKAACDALGLTLYADYIQVTDPS